MTALCLRKKRDGTWELVRTIEFKVPIDNTIGQDGVVYRRRYADSELGIFVAEEPVDEDPL